MGRRCEAVIRHLGNTRVSKGMRLFASEVMISKCIKREMDKSEKLVLQEEDGRDAQGAE